MTDFFGPGSPYLNHPLLTAERTTSEVGDLTTALGLDPGATVLDVGCGFGRHCLEFARRGYRPTGIDPSPTMVGAARAAAVAEGLDIPLVVSGDPDMVATDPGFDGAMAMFTTIGQVGDDGCDNVTAGLLGSVARALRPGQRFVLEVPQRDAAVRSLVPAERFGEGDNRTEIFRRFDPGSSRVIERFEVVTDGIVRTFDLAYRLFAGTELEGLLSAAGFVGVVASTGLGELAATANSGRQAPVAGECSAAQLDPEAATMVLMATNGGRTGQQSSTAS